MASFSTVNETELQKVESHLASHQFLGGNVPSQDDVRVYWSLAGAPDRTKYPNFYNLYATLSNFTAGAMKQFQGKFAVAPTQTAQAQPQKPAQKQEAKKEEEEVDLFGSDNSEDEAAHEEMLKRKVAEHQAAKGPKKVVVAKSIIVFDVKVYEQETDLKELAAQILALEVDGLVWNKNYEIKPVAYGMNKLQMGCVVEDLKVSQDDLFERIEGLGDELVQSVDVVSFQKV